MALYNITNWHTEPDYKSSVTLHYTKQNGTTKSQKHQTPTDIEIEVNYDDTEDVDNGDFALDASAWIYWVTGAASSIHIACYNYQVRQKTAL